MTSGGALIVGGQGGQLGMVAGVLPLTAPQTLLASAVVPAAVVVLRDRVSS
jgi:hypothetical protein